MKLKLLAKENNSKKMSYGSTSVDDNNQFMFDCSHDYYWLKAVLKLYSNNKIYLEI